jgi:hypothetical protein
MSVLLGITYGRGAEHFSVLLLVMMLISILHIDNHPTKD